MRNDAIRWLALALAACAGVEAPEGPAGADERFIQTSTQGQIPLRAPRRIGPPAVDPPVEPADAAVTTTWVGIKSDPLADCPVPQTTPYDLAPIFPGYRWVGGDLARFCLYTSRQPSFTAAPFPQPATVGLVALGPDHAVITPHASRELATMFAPSYRDQFLLHGGRVDALSSAVGPGVRIALVDSSPDAPPGSGHLVRGSNLHGWYLAQQLRDLLCDGLGSCIGEISSRLALSLSYDEAAARIFQPPRGGDFGTLLGLASAIHLELHDWLATGQPSGQRLVINLSLGWHPDYGGAGDLVDAWPADVQAVYASILEATCEGAIVVAAAGNDSGGPTGREGPIYPGGWETFRVDPARCATLLREPGRTYASTAGRSLLVAAGAVNETGVLDLALSRDDSRPPLVAYGDHATAWTGASAIPYTLPMTGTSVSTAVISAAVAAVWENLPGEAPAAVLELVRDSGAPAGTQASHFCTPLPGNPCESRRIRVCDAVRYACDVANPGACVRSPGPVACEPITITTPTAPAAALARFEATTPAVPLVYRWAPASAAACGASALYGPAPWPSAEPCLDDQYYDDDLVFPFVVPQPHDSECPVCFLVVSTGQIYLEQDRSFAAVDSLTLHVEDSLGGSADYTIRAIPPTNAVVFTIDPVLVQDTVAAKVTARINDTSYISEIDVFP